MEILLLRHGKTNGNLQHRYVGRTDEPLCGVGKEELELQFRSMLDKNGNRNGNEDIALFFQMIRKQPHPHFFVSPMRRCIETLDILKQVLEVKDAQITVVPDLREMDFGKFEYRNYEELKDDPDYQRYIDTNGTTVFPDGEELCAFKLRCTASFQALLEKYRSEGINDAIGVVHGGTIMSLMEAHAPLKRSFFSWQVKNGEGFLLNL